MFGVSEVLGFFGRVSEPSIESVGHQAANATYGPACLGGVTCQVPTFSTFYLKGWGDLVPGGYQ